MKAVKGVLICCALLSLLVAPAALAATTGTATVTLSAASNALVQVLDPSVTLTPTVTDYENNFVEATGAAGIDVRVRTNSSTGMVLYVRCSDASPQITLSDLAVRTQSAAGAGGSTMSSYTAVTSSNQLLWSTGTAQAAWLTVTTDARINNLINYQDAITAGTTDYTNTLTYTVVAQ